MKVSIPATVINIHLTEEEAIELVAQLGELEGTYDDVAYKLFEQLVNQLELVPEIVVL